MFVHYVGCLTDGSKFDSSRDRGDRFSFNLGKSEVIKGWDLGVATMKIGEKSMFTIKAEYGYGSAGSPPKIPGKTEIRQMKNCLDIPSLQVTQLSSSRLNSLNSTERM